MSSIYIDKQGVLGKEALHTQYDTVKVFEDGRKYYRHDGEHYETTSALRRALSSEYGGAWIEEKNEKKRYFVDEWGWFRRSIREVSKEEFAQKLETPSTWQKVLGLGLGILALAPGVSEWVRHIPKETAPGLLALQQKNLALSLVSYSLFPSHIEAQAVGTEFQVNTNTTAQQSNPSVAVLQDGDFLVVWQSFGQDGESWGVFGKRYDVNGSVIQPEFQISFSQGSQQSPSAAGLMNGGFVVAWENGQDGSGFGIFGQRFDANGTAIDSEFPVNSYTTNHQLNSGVAGLHDGGFIVVWDSDGQDGQQKGVFGQRYTLDGVSAGVEFQVNTNPWGTQQLPSVASLENGFVITWQTNQQQDAGPGVYGQIYLNNGTSIGTNFRIDTFSASMHGASTVAALESGIFVVSWESNHDGDTLGIFGQKCFANGTFIGSEFQINTVTAGEQRTPSVAGLIDGGFVVAWIGIDSDGRGIFGQRYDANGSPVGIEFQVNSFNIGQQWKPSIVGLDDGGFVVTWGSGSSQDGDREGIFGQRYDANGSAVGPPSLTTSESLTSLLESTEGPRTNTPSSNLSTVQSSTYPTVQSESTITWTDSQSSLPRSTGSISQIADSDSTIFTSESQFQTQSTSTRGQDSDPTTTTIQTLPSSRMSAFGSSRLVSGFFSLIDMVYLQQYPIIQNGQTIGTFSFSGGTGQINSSNPNILNIHFNPGFAPEEEEIIPLFSIPSGQATDWQNIQLGDTNFECLEAHAEINPSTSGNAEFGLVFTGADSCTASGSQIVAGILPIMMN